MGPKVEGELAGLDVETVLDLITYYPRRYIDGTRLVPIADAAAPTNPPDREISRTRTPSPRVRPVGG